MASLVFRIPLITRYRLLTNLVTSTSLAPLPFRTTRDLTLPPPPTSFNHPWQLSTGLPARCWPIGCRETRRLPSMSINRHPRCRSRRSSPWIRPKGFYTTAILSATRRDATERDRPTVSPVKLIAWTSELFLVLNNFQGFNKSIALVHAFELITFFKILLYLDKQL